MGTTRIKVIDLSQEVEQIKTSRKRAVKGLVGEIRKPLARKKKTTPKAVVEEIKEKEGEVEEKLEEAKVLEGEVKVEKKKEKFAQVRGEKYQKVKSLVDPLKLYPIDEAIDLVKKTSYAKFDGSVEVHIITSSKDVRGTVTLPHSFRRKKKILVFTSERDGIKKDGILIGDEKTLKEIEEGKLVPQKDFQKVVATPDFMPKIAKIAKILGPKGLMPNPKTGTVTDDPKKIIEKFEAGLVDLKPEQKAPVIHTAIGKVSLEEKKLKENLLALISAIGPQKIKKLVLSPTMGPGIKVDLSSISQKKDTY